MHRGHEVKRLDPRTKLALGLMGVVAVLLTRQPLVLAVEFFLVCASLPVFGRDFRLFFSWARSLRTILPMVALVFAVAFFSYDLKVALVLTIRLLDLLTVSFVFFQTIDPEDLGGSLRKMGIPFTFSFILTSSFRYVPLIGRRIRGIADAQRSRGIDLRPRIRNIPHFTALLTPLLIQSFLLAEQMAMAMESRGFARNGRSCRKEYRLSSREYLLIMASLGLLAVFALWQRG